MPGSSLAASLILGSALAISTAAGARAAELKVLARGSMTAVMGELAPQFERTTGHKLSIQFAGTPELIKLAA